MIQNYRKMNVRTSIYPTLIYERNQNIVLIRPDQSIIIIPTSLKYMQSLNRRSLFRARTKDEPFVIAPIVPQHRHIDLFYLFSIYYLLSVNDFYYFNFHYLTFELRTRASRLISLSSCSIVWLLNGTRKYNGLIN